MYSRPSDQGRYLEEHESWLYPLLLLPFNHVPSDSFIYHLFACLGCNAASLDTAGMVNTSVLFGTTTTAAFTCNLVGTPGIGEVMTISKVTNGVSTTISQNTVATNTTKHSVTGTYVLNINDVVWTDEGEYQCALTGTTPGTATAYLTVGSKYSYTFSYCNHTPYLTVVIHLILL